MSWSDPYGEKMPTPRKERVTPEEDRRVVGVLMAALKTQGWSDRKIGRRFGLYNTQVKRILDRLPQEARTLCG